jgi:hypothetical protein
MKAGARFLSSLLPPDQTRVQTFVVPALRKLREGRGTPLAGDANEIKGWATRRSASILIKRARMLQSMMAIRF